MTRVNMQLQVSSKSHLHAQVRCSLAGMPLAGGISVDEDCMRMIAGFVLQVIWTVHPISETGPP